MKKFQFLSMALAAVALASCSGDDLEVAGNYELPHDGTEVFVTINEPASDITRAGFATEAKGLMSVAQRIYFTEGDVFKMYCSDTWKPQVYKFKEDAKVSGVNGSVFEWADADSKYNKGDVKDLANREYGVYPADNFEFDNEKREHLLFTLKSPIKYGEYAGVDNDVDENGRKIYKALVPLFGFCKNDNVTFDYMTSLLRVEMLGMETGKEYTMTLTSTGTAKYKLSGVFTSTEFDATEGAAGKIPVYTTSTTTETEEQSIVLTFTPTEADGIVYLPLPAGTYNLNELKLTYKVGNDGSDVEIPMYTLDKNQEGTARIACSAVTEPYELGTGTKLLAAVENNAKPDPIKNLTELNNLLAEYADFGRAVTVNVTLGADILVYGENSQMIETAQKLFVPELKNDVTLNLQIGSSDNYAIKGDNGVTTLVICDKDNVGTGKLTINLAADDDDYKAAEISLAIESESKHSIVLGGTYSQAVTFDAGNDANVGFAEGFSGQAVTITSAKDVIMNGTFADAVNVVAADNVNLAGTFSSTVNVGTAETAVTGKVTLGGTANGKITVYAASFEESADANIANSADITATSIVTLAGKTGRSTRIDVRGSAAVVISSQMNNANVVKQGTGDVTIDEDAAVKMISMMSSGTLTVNGNVTNVLSMYNGKLIVNSEMDCKQLSIMDDKSIEKEKVEIVLNAGNFDKIANASDVNAEVETYGAVTIKEVDDDTKGSGKTIITAYWDTTTTEAAKTADAATANNGNIYTALQLAALNKLASPTSINLYADVKAKDGGSIAWTPLTIYSEKLTGSDAITVDGKGHSISNLTLSGTNNVGFFGRIKPNTSSTYTGKVTIKDLTLAYSSIAASKYAGGLIGNVVGVDVDIEGVKVTANSISGTAYIGGLIGMLSGGKTVEVKDGDDVVSVSAFTLTGTPGTTEYGRFGMLVGSVNDETSKFKATAATSKKLYQTNTINNDQAEKLDFSKQIKVESGHSFSFTGSTDNEVGYSPKLADSNVTINGNAYDGNSKANGSQNTTVNWFGNFIQ